MTIDDAMLMAYADDELGPIERRHVDQAMAADPALADRIAAFGALTGRLRDGFAPIVQAPVPDRLAAMLTTNVIIFAPKRPGRSWIIGSALAASLTLAVGLATQWNSGRQPPAAGSQTPVVGGHLAHALDTQFASTAGDVRILVSFRHANQYCRIFASAAIDGIACREGDGWRLHRTQSGSAGGETRYRQAASADAALLAIAQNMMDGEPLTASDEQRARVDGWR